MKKLLLTLLIAVIIISGYIAFFAPAPTTAQNTGNSTTGGQIPRETLPFERLPTETLPFEYSGASFISTKEFYDALAAIDSSYDDEPLYGITIDSDTPIARQEATLQVALIKLVKDNGRPYRDSTDSDTLVKLTAILLSKYDAPWSSTLSQQEMSTLLQLIS